MKLSAVGKAYNFLYNGILSRKFPMGSPISESEIAKALGVSRAPVREVLKRMETEGLVTHFHGKSTFIIDITQGDLEEIFELRKMFELHALRTAYRYIEDEILDRLENKVLMLNNESNIQQYYDTNSELHSTIIAYGGNKRLEKFFNMLAAQFAIINRISSRNPENLDNFRNNHLQIIRALKARDLESAERYLSEHLCEVQRRTIKEYTEPSAIKIGIKNRK